MQQKEKGGVGGHIIILEVTNLMMKIAPSIYGDQLCHFSCAVVKNITSRLPFLSAPGEARALLHLTFSPPPANPFAKLLKESLIKLLQEL